MVSVPRALATAAVLLGALQTTAQAKELVVAIFGGFFLDNSCHGAPFEKRTGAKVNFVLGNSVQNVAKLRAAQGRSEVDVAYMDLQIVQQAKAEGLLQKVNAERVPNLKDLCARSWGELGLVLIEDAHEVAVASAPEAVDAHREAGLHRRREARIQLFHRLRAW